MQTPKSQGSRQAAATVPVMVRLSPEERDAFRAYCASEQRSMNGQLRHWIASALREDRVAA